MSKEEVISYFISNGNSFNVKKTLIMLCIGLVVGLFIYATYYICCDKTVYNKKFNGTILVTLLITELIMMMISSNIAVSLGMVGALSIVRFRTALKDSRDTIFLFWAIAEGLCVGTESYKMVIVSVMFISVVFIVLSKTASLSNKYLIVINGLQQDIDIEEINNEYKTRIENTQSKFEKNINDPNLIISQNIIKYVKTERNVLSIIKNCGNHF